MPNTTIVEVAKRAGVSPATVSYVLSGHRTISKNTQVRVRRAIEELNYTPHAGARSLRVGKTDMVALVVPFYDWSSETVLMPFVYGAVHAARQHGWNVVLVTSDGGSDVDSLVRSKTVDGVVLMEVRVGDERLKVVERLGIPSVALGMPLEPVSIPFVDLDFEAAARCCVERLAGAGHKHVALFASPPGTFEKKLGYARRFWHGVAGALEKAGLRFYGLPVEPTMDGAQRALDELLAEEPALSGFIVQTEAVADLLLRVLQQRGKLVPDDFSIVGVAWGEAVKHLEPPLTYVNFPSVEIGRIAIELLAKKAPGALLPAILVEGATVASPRKT
jgi:DNA-binding LacI/PurR family transcriptional regulator